MSNEPSSKWGFDRRVGIVEVLVGLLGIAVAILVTKEGREQVLPYWRPAGKILLIVSFAILVVAAVWRTRGLKNTKAGLEKEKMRVDELDGENKKLKAERDRVISENRTLKQRVIQEREKEDRGRWETVTKIVYGHLAYQPFLEYDDRHDPVGPGVEWLHQLLSYSLDGRGTIKVDFAEEKGNWTNIFQGLIARQYDVIATPLFATFDRSRQVAFTTPLFFSNVGFYVSKAISQLPIWKDIQRRGLKSALAQAGKLEFLAVAGEISEKLASKYADEKNDTIKVFGGDVVPRSLFSKIADAEGPQRALFCESYYAHLQPLVKCGAVVNILPSYQILYPVCFAVRRGDYQLLNLLNIRLLQFARNGGAIPKLATKFSNGGDVNLALRSVKEHFVAEWPCSVEMEKITHA